METKKIDIGDMAHFTLMYFIKNSISINHLKLQKILYYLQAWHLVYFDKNPLFEEVPEAWVNGPVYRPIYNQLKDLGTYNNLVLNDSYGKNIDDEFIKIKEKINLGKDQSEFIDSIFKHYGLMSHEKLVFLTHSEKPWNSAREGMGPFDYSDNKISLDLMYDFYKNRLELKNDK